MNLVTTSSPAAIHDQMRMPSDQTDEELLAAARRNGDAFAVFYRRHAPTLLGYLTRRETSAAALLSTEADYECRVVSIYPPAPRCPRSRILLRWRPDATTWRTSEARIAKALAHPLRARILQRLGERVASPGDLALELGAPLGVVSYHVRMLRDYDCVELVRTEPRRGALHFYRATARPTLDEDQWKTLPSILRKELSGETLAGIHRPQRHAAATGLVGVADAGESEDHAAGREVRPAHVLHQARRVEVRVRASRSSAASGSHSERWRSNLASRTSSGSRDAADRQAATWRSSWSARRAPSRRS
jgi:DNA-binding transcriptional ArsR family regulator